MNLSEPQTFSEALLDLNGRKLGVLARLLGMRVREIKGMTIEEFIALIEDRLGSPARSSAAEQRNLTPQVVGSNPTAPATPLER